MVFSFDSVILVSIIQTFIDGTIFFSQNWEHYINCNVYIIWNWFNSEWKLKYQKNFDLFYYQYEPNLRYYEAWDGSLLRPYVSTALTVASLVASRQQPHIVRGESKILQYFVNVRKLWMPLPMSCRGWSPLDHEIPSSPDTLQILLAEFASVTCLGNGLKINSFWLFLIVEVLATRAKFL